MTGATFATNKFDISTASYSQNFSVNSQETSPEGIAFNTDGTKMFVVGITSDNVNEYDLTTGFDVSTATYSQSFSVNAQEANPRGLEFNTDGTKMFIVGNTADTVFEYDLTTGFDVSTASYSQSFSVSAQETFPTGIAFNTDGTKMFIVGVTGDDVNEYTLSTGFDVSTASYSQNFSVASQDTEPRDVAFNTDGTKMFILGNTGDDVNEYNLTTGFDVSTASYSQNFSVSSQDTNPRSIAFNSDGTKMFMLGSNGADVNEYTLSSGFDVSTASYSQNFSVSSQESVPEGMAFNTDGTKMFITGTSGDDVNEYTLSTGFDVSTASYSQNFSVSAQETEPTGIAFNSDGTKMFIVGTNGIEVNEYTLGSTAIPTGYHAVHTTTSTDSTYWTDINSMTADEAAGDGSIFYCISTDDRSTWKIAHNTDGIRSIVRNNSGTWQYNSNGTYASTTWANATTNAELAALQEAMTGATFATNKFDISTASYSQNFSVNSQETSPEGMAFNTDGTKMFVVGITSDNVNEYALSTGFDVSTASFTQSFSVSAQEANPRGL